MKLLGHILLALGALVGFAAGVSLLLGIDRLRLPWLVAIGLVKLTIVASFGIMTAGAMLIRLTRKARARTRVDAGA